MLSEHNIDPVRLANAKLQSEANAAALKLLDCMFTIEELVNGNPSGKTNSKDPDRIATITILDPARMKYIYGEYAQYTCITIICYISTHNIALTFIQIS